MLEARSPARLTLSQRAYEAASAELQRWLEGRTRPDRLSEMESLLGV